MGYCCLQLYGVRLLHLRWFHVYKKVESRAFPLINSITLTLSKSLSARRIVTSLYVYFCYYNRLCYSKLLCRIPPPLRRARVTRFSTQYHPFSGQLSDRRFNSYAQSFMYSTGKVRNMLLLSVFSSFTELHTFKRRVSCYVSHFRQHFQLFPELWWKLVILWPLPTRG